MDDRKLTVKEAAKIAGCSDGSLRNAMMWKRFPYHKVPGQHRVYILESDLQKWLSVRRHKQTHNPPARNVPVENPPARTQDSPQHSAAERALTGLLYALPLNRHWSDADRARWLDMVNTILDMTTTIID